LDGEGRVGDLGFAFAGAGAILDEGKSQFDRGLLVAKRLLYADRLAMDLKSTIEHVAVIVVTDGDTVLGPRIAILANFERAPGDGDRRTPLKAALEAYAPLGPALEICAALEAALEVRTALEVETELE